MPSSKSDPQRYLILADATQNLPELLRQAGDGIIVLDTIGPAGAPHTAVVTMSPEQAAALARRFQNLKIEPDQPLSPFGDGNSAGRHERKQNGKEP